MTSLLTRGYTRGLLEYDTHAAQRCQRIHVRILRTRYMRVKLQY